MHFHPFARPIIGLQGGFYFAPPPPPDSSYHFFNDLFLINNSSLGSGRRFKINSGYFKYGPLEPGYLLSPPPAGGGGGYLFQAHLRKGEA